MSSTHDSHTSTRTYWQIAALLAVITAVEYFILKVELPKGFVLTVLFALSALKFGFVAAYFMHLKNDSRLFSWFFATGMAFALGIGLAVMYIMMA